MIEIPEGSGQGHWQRILVDAYEDAPFWSAIIWCPSCAKPLSLVRHAIADDGQVSPSVGHPDSYAPCGWHVTPKLLGWEVRPAPTVPVIELCQRCGAKARMLGGWGTWSGGAGLICPACIQAHTATK